MKIGFALDDTLDVQDGVQQAVITIGEYMRSQGHDVHYITSQTNRQDLLNVHSLTRTIRVTFNGNKMRIPLPVSRKKIKHFLSQHNFDVLHVQMPYSPLFIEKLILCSPENTKIIGTFHILPYTKISSVSTRLLGLLLSRSLKKFDNVISVSEPARLFCLKAFKAESIVIPNPIALQKFKNIKKNKHEYKQIVFLGRLVERKGARELLEAYRKFLEDNETLRAKCELVIAGKGEQDKTLKFLAGSFPEGTNIKFLGFVDERDKPRLLGNADLAVFPSTGGESFGIVLVEAMASGSRLILAGDNPGYASVMHDFPGLLVNPKDTTKFAEKLRELLEDNQYNSALSAKLSKESEKYDIVKVAGSLLKLYSS